jgi:hypothetical protein
MLLPHSIEVDTTATETSLSMHIAADAGIAHGFGSTIRQSFPVFADHGVWSLAKKCERCWFA